MKPNSTVLALLCSLGLTAASASAVPRVGVHPGFTRLVFSAPAHTTIQQVRQVQASSHGSAAARTVSITLSQPLAPAHAALHQPGLHGYQTSGRTLQVYLNQPGQVKVRMLTATSGQTPRVVVDVPAPASAVYTASYKAPPATPVAAARLSASRGLSRPQVVLDAGHGGVDPGMQSQWVTEKVVTLDVALRVRQILQAHGVLVKMVRDRDRDLSDDKVKDLDARARMAEADKVAAYIAIHVNAGGPDAQGIETYYFGQPMGGSTRSLAVAENGGDSVGQALTRQAANMAQSTMGDILAQAKLSFSRQLAQRVQSRLLSQTGALNRGVHTDAFYVIRNPKTAAILTEIGFGTNASEGPKLATSAYRQKIAEGIAQAILEFLHVN